MPTLKELPPNTQGVSWYDPKAKRFYGGRIGDYQGGMLVDVSTIESVNVLVDLLGLARPKYTLDGAVRVVSTPELVLSVDTETVGAGNEFVQPLEESLISEKSFTRKNLECDLNEVHIVVEDRAAMKASHDVLRLNIEDAAQEIARIRNHQIITELLADSTAATVTGDEWDTTTGGVSDHNPMAQIGAAFNQILGAGYNPDYIAMGYGDWADFISNTHICGMVQAGIFNVTGQNMTLPGYPGVRVLLDAACTDETIIVGSSRGTILAEGPTESVKYRNELKRYTGYIIRQYIDPEVVIPTAVYHFHV